MIQKSLPSTNKLINIFFVFFLPAQPTSLWKNKFKMSSAAIVTGTLKFKRASTSENRILITETTSKVSGEPVQKHSLTRTFTVHRHIVGTWRSFRQNEHVCSPNRRSRVRIWRTIKWKTKRSFSRMLAQKRNFLGQRLTLTTPHSRMQIYFITISSFLK